MAIQQLMLGVGAKKKTYVDDVFSVYAKSFYGNTNIVNNIDLSGEGGLVWTKLRNITALHQLIDTENGVNKYLRSNGQNALTDSSYVVTSFNNNGYTFNDGYGGANDHISWTFRKAKGFFDIVTYTGTGSARTISHSLGSVPGIIMVKKTNSTGSWAVYHRELSAATHYLVLNSSNEEANNTNFWNGTHPTSTHFSVGTDTDVNGDGDEFVAYVFAGGESTAATARSCDFDGSGDYLDTSTSTDYDLGTGDFTLECWIKPETDSDYRVIADKRSNSSDKFLFYIDNSNSTHHRKIKFYSSGADRISSDDYAINDNVWQHVALVRSSAKTKIYVNGTQVGSTYSDTNDYDYSTIRIGADYTGGNSLNGAISNYRLVKGTAVYTSSFRPPTEPLTSISGTVLLCCNNSSVTGTTTGTLTATGNVAAITASPFDDPAAFTFGENGDQSIISCGSYVGNGTTNEGPTVHCGFEPSYLFIKNITGTGNWWVGDHMRGMHSNHNGYTDKRMNLDTSDSESSDLFAEFTPTGFKINQNDGNSNTNDSKYVYMAIRRPDGYVGKPASAGTDVFAMDVGDMSTVIPNFDANFAVDFAINRAPASTSAWETSARMMEGQYIELNQTTGEAAMSNGTWDSNVGWNENSNKNSSVQSWMWKRHVGFDVVAYDGNGTVGRQIPHNLSKTPEMIWVKNRSISQAWKVYHKGLNGGTNPWEYSLDLNDNTAEVDDTQFWNDTAPTSTAVTTGGSTENNHSGSNHIMMLFASVDGISKLGYYDGQGTAKTISGLGFTPRFLIVKRTDNSGGWNCFDTLRGWGSGNDSLLELDVATSANSYEWGAPTSDGFTVEETSDLNTTGGKYIYYAHA